MVSAFCYRILLYLLSIYCILIKIYLLLTGSGTGTTCGADTLDGIVTGDQLVYGMSYDEKTGAWYFAVATVVSTYILLLA